MKNSMRVLLVLFMVLLSSCSGSSNKNEYLCIVKNDGMVDFSKIKIDHPEATLYLIENNNISLQKQLNFEDVYPLENENKIIKASADLKGTMFFQTDELVSDDSNICQPKHFPNLNLHIDQSEDEISSIYFVADDVKESDHEYEYTLDENLKLHGYYILIRYRIK